VRVGRKPGLRVAPAMVVLAVLVGLTAAGCGGSDRDSDGHQGRAHGQSTSGVPSKDHAGLLLDFEEGLETDQDVTDVPNAGTGKVDVDVRFTGEAEVEVVEAPDGGHAVRFPAYTAQDTAPAAVIVATSSDPGVLDPGDQDFTFGASFQLDAESSGSQADNGDNLVQRGTFDSPGQYKIQLDHDVPSCRIQGDAGQVFVKADGPIDPGAWYSVSCERTDSQVTLKVTALLHGKGGGTWQASGETGNISLKDLPLTVGGKTSPDGVPVASPDQFNGAVDNVFVSVD
jgi:hypothetical protein